jgi:hypothetical protein
MEKTEWISKISELLLEADKIARKNNVDNLFYNEMFMELILADKLGHTWESHTQGSDAIETETQKPTEYKLINLRNKSGSGSYQFHWLSDDKMVELSKTENMFFAQREGIVIKEVLKLPTKVILPLIAEKATGSKSIHGHKSFSHSTIKKLGGQIIYENRDKIN